MIMACINWLGEGGPGRRELDHSIISFWSKYCSCPWLRFPTCFQCHATRDAVCRNSSSWAWHRPRLAALLVPRRLGKGSSLNRPLVAGQGTELRKPSDCLGWQGRRRAEESPIVACGKVGFLHDRKSLGSAPRVTCLGRGCCHQPCSIGTSQRQRGRNFLLQPLLRQPPVPGW